MPDQKDGPVSPCFSPVRIPGELKFEDLTAALGLSERMAQAAGACSARRAGRLGYPLPGRSSRAGQRQRGFPAGRSPVERWLAGFPAHLGWRAYGPLGSQQPGHRRIGPGRFPRGRAGWTSTPPIT